MLYETLYRFARNALPARFTAHRYPYMFTPAQLVVLVRLLDEAVRANPDAAVIEVGCASGHTTVFLGRHLADQRWRGEYHCYDTFGGFQSDDIAYEVKRTPDISAERFSGFRLNSKAWVQANLDRNADKIAVVHLHQADASQHDFTEFTQAAFVLLDVDVFKPTAHALRVVWPKMAPGGIIVIDDCNLDPETCKPVLTTKFSGGHEALITFAAEHEIKIEYAASKLAVLRKPSP